MQSSKSSESREEKGKYLNCFSLGAQYVLMNVLRCCVPAPLPPPAQRYHTHEQDILLYETSLILWSDSSNLETLSHLPDVKKKKN